MVKKTSLYVISGSVVLFIALLIVSVVYSPRSPVEALQTVTVNCTGANLSFTYYTPSSINAQIDTNTFGVVHVNSTGNTNSSVSLTADQTDGLSVSVAKPFNMSSGKYNYYTEYEIINPTLLGNYTLNFNLSNFRGSCQYSKSFDVNVHVVKSPQNSTNSS
ncbi:MAG: hypothetical protein M1433_02530 [Candidatus Parvarchaeota archaeon]|nr:hypothetical protein [Candidatus Parvarchaeota archaeon]